MQARPSVLIVEDSPVTQRILGAILEHAGFRLSRASSVLDAHDRARIEMPDVILMDVGLDDGDGLDLARVLKRDPRTASIPIFAMSARQVSDLPVRARACGCDGFAPKPFGIHQLAWSLVRSGRFGYEDGGN